jgi:Ca-activated chloride channel homolog
MTFYWAHLLWLLAVPVLLLLFEALRRRAGATDQSFPKIQKAEAGTHDLEISSSAAPRATHPRIRARWRLYVGLALLIVAAARPQWGKLDEPVFDQAREILIGIDLSRSMLATDVRPSRLERAKLLVTSLLERLAGERVGLVVFAGTAFLQSPLSSDYEILNEFLPSLAPDYMPQGGSNYRALLETSLSAFNATSAADRFLIVLSDGEATDEHWKEVVPELKDKGVRVIGLGIGTAQGSIIPDPAGGYVKNEQGAVVLSKLEPATLQELAQLTNGVYADASSWVDLAQLLAATVETGRKGEFRETRATRMVERFQWVLAPAVLILLWSLYREFPVRPRARDIRLKPKNPITATTTASVAIALAALSHGAKLEAATEENTLAAPLAQLVGQFAERQTLGAREYAELARTTVTYAERTTAAQQPVTEGAIRDALTAVDRGESLDPKAADWPKLREELQRFLQDPEKPPPQQNQNEQQPKDQNQQEKNQQQSQQDQRDQQKEQKNSEDKESSEQSGGQKKEDEERQKQDQQKESPSSSPKGNEAEQKKQNEAFGDMQKEEASAPTPTPRPSQQSEMQKVGGARPNEKQTPPADPALVVPLQRLEQLKGQDSPIRLHQLMRGEKEQPTSTGKNW